MSLEETDGKVFYNDYLFDTSRLLALEVIIRKDERGERVLGPEGDPVLDGLALHQHMEISRFSEEGIETEKCCDYVMINMEQAIWLKKMLSSLQIKHIETGEVIDE